MGSLSYGDVSVMGCLIKTVFFHTDSLFSQCQHIHFQRVRGLFNLLEMSS